MSLRPFVVKKTSPIRSIPSGEKRHHHHHIAPITSGNDGSVLAAYMFTSFFSSLPRVCYVCAFVRVQIPLYKKNKRMQNKVPQVGEVNGLELPWAKNHAS